MLIKAMSRTSESSRVRWIRGYLYKWQPLFLSLYTYFWKFCRVPGGPNRSPPPQDKHTRHRQPRNHPGMGKVGHGSHVPRHQDATL